MALLTLHSIPLVREYQSTLISRASFFACFCFLLCVFAPLLVAYSSHGFWVKYSVHREQPDVRFKYQALLLARSSSGDVTWSTFSEYNSLTRHYLNFPSITTLEKDENDDGLVDGLEISLELKTNETIQFVHLFLIFSYKLKDISYITMETLGIIQYNSGIPFCGLRYVGDLQWIQRRVVNFRHTDSRYNQTVMKEFEISEVLKAYSEREYGTEMRNEHYTPIFGTTDGLLKIQAYIRYTQAVVEYMPGLWNILKWAWIQYASVLVIFFYVVGTVKNVVYSQHMVPTWNEKQIQTISR